MSVPFDYAAMRTQLGDDDELIEDVVRLYLEDCPIRVRALHDAVAGRDAAAVRAVAHTMKGSAASLCAAGVVAAARQLEASAATADFDAIAIDVQELTRQVDELLAALEGVGQQTREC